MIKSYISFVLIVILLLPIVTLSGCSSKYLIKKEKQIQHMTDNELLSYYHGITDRIKDIDNKYKDHIEISEPRDQDQTHIFPYPHHIGTNSYQLYEVRELVIKEIHKRGLSIK